jgi:hypothetical protein
MVVARLRSRTLAGAEHLQEEEHRAGGAERREHDMAEREPALQPVFAASDRA